MSKFSYLRGLFVLLLGLGSLSAAHASHMRGGDISYASIASTTAGVPRYHVVVRKFLTPSTPIGTVISLTASKGGCYTGAPNAFVVSMPRTLLAAANPLFCVTGSSTAPLYEVNQYEADLDLPAGQWLLSTSETARTDIQNIANSLGQSCYIEAYLDNTGVTQNASPKFESVLQPFISLNAFAQHSLSAFDADGDSLRYESIIPYGACGQPVAGTIAPHFGLNAATGALMPLVASASTQGNYNVTVRVSEYRRTATNRWALIGYVTRENLYILYATTNLPPTFTSLSVNGGASRSPSSPILIQPGQTVNVTLTAADPDAGQLLRFTSEAPSVVPGLSLTTLSPTQVKLTWQVPAALLPGRYAIPVAVLDNGCSNGSEDRTLVFVVGNQPLASRTAATAATAATNVYPVPFREQVQFTTAPNQAVVLVDALGREVARLTSAANGLVRWQPAAALPAGLYVARGADGRALARLLRAGE